MAYNSVSGSLFKKMITNGAINLKNNYQEVDSLNVFPVPDGDTGTNMSMTMMSGINEIDNFESHSLSDISKTVSRGFLMGARGNSGVILSQYFRGVSVGMKAIKGSSASINEFVDALVSGNRIAYQAVMEPVEGTILTVMREAGEEIDKRRAEFKTVDGLLKVYLERAKESLANTPNILPVLKEANVVDSGGAGFVKVVEGMYLASIGKMLELKDEDAETEEENEVKEEIEHIQKEESRFLYDMTFDIIIKDPENFQAGDLRSPLSIIGDGLSINVSNNVAHVTISTNNPGRALNMGQRHGEFKAISIINNKIGDVLEEPEEPVAPEEEMQDGIGIVAVCFGSGIKDTFKELGATDIIDGGQTMNPSTQSFVEAISKMNTNHVIVIPNNSNVIMSAKQAAELVEGKTVEVLPTKNIAHGFAAIANYDSEASFEENIEAMKAAISHVESIEITYAVRDTEINGIKIEVNDTMAILNDKIVAATKDRFKAIKKALTRSVSADSIVVTIFKGKDANDDEVNQIQEYVEVLNADCEVEVIEGNQDIYSYIICVE